MTYLFSESPLKFLCTLYSILDLAWDGEYRKRRSSWN